MFSPIELLYGRFVRHERLRSKGELVSSVRAASDRIKAAAENLSAR